MYQVRTIITNTFIFWQFSYVLKLGDTSDRPLCTTDNFPTTLQITRQAIRV